MPHMHLRGHDIQYRAVYPDGNSEMLLAVPRWDFNWQTTYRFTEPKSLPKGTRVEVTAHYDNSADRSATDDAQAVFGPGKMVGPNVNSWIE